jgi:hypothetical protein
MFDRRGLVALFQHMVGSKARLDIAEAHLAASPLS